MLQRMKYTALMNLREKSAVFWTLAFPIILGTLFHFALGGIDQYQKMEQIPVAVVQEHQSGREEKTFQMYLEELEEEILDLQVMEEDEAQKAMEDGKVIGIFYNGAQRKLEVLSNGLEPSILSGLLESYEKYRAMFLGMAKDGNLNIQVLQESMSYGEVTKSVSLGGKTMSEKMIYFFALLGMTCLYGGFLGLYGAIHMQANLSPQGARCAVTPVSQKYRVAVDTLTIFLIHFLEILLVVFFLVFVLGELDISGNWGKVLAVLAFGSWFGVAAGMLIGSIGKIGEGAKIGIFLAFSMLSSFLSGLMVGNVKYLVERHLPIVNRLNPAALISDAFYCICVYDDGARYTRDLLLLAVLSICCGLAAYLAVRRVRYDSI